MTAQRRAKAQVGEAITKPTDETHANDEVGSPGRDEEAPKQKSVASPIARGCCDAPVTARETAKARGGEAITKPTDASLRTTKSGAQAQPKKLRSSNESHHKSREDVAAPL